MWRRRGRPSWGKSLGPESGSTTTTFRSAVASVVEATRDAGIADILARNPEHAAACLEHGFTFVGVGSDATLLASAGIAATTPDDYLDGMVTLRTWRRKEEDRWATVSSEHDQRACCFASVRREIIHFRTVNAAGKIS